jgi:hypothetical protein
MAATKEAAKRAATDGKPSTAAKKSAEAEIDVRGIEIPRPKLLQAKLNIEGVSPLIQHRWSEKSLAMLEGAQTGRAKAPKEKRQPEEEALAAAYVVPGKEDLPDGQEGKYSMPAPAFKHAFLFGVGQLDDIKKFPRSKATGWVFVDHDPVLRFDEMVLRTDTGRIGGGTATMIYRPQFNGWGCDLDITYNANSISLEQIVSLFELGGTGGVGEWRPSAPKNKSGDFGRFRVVGVEEYR